MACFRFRMTLPMGFRMETASTIHIRLDLECMHDSMKFISLLSMATTNSNYYAESIISAIVCCCLETCAGMIKPEWINHQSAISGLELVTRCMLGEDGTTKQHWCSSNGCGS